MILILNVSCIVFIWNRVQVLIYIDRNSLFRKDTIGHLNTIIHRRQFNLWEDKKWEHIFNNQEFLKGTTDWVVIVINLNSFSIFYSIFQGKNNDITSDALYHAQEFTIKSSGINLQISKMTLRFSTLNIPPRYFLYFSVFYNNYYFYAKPERECFKTMSILIFSTIWDQQILSW